jgi:uncharacterized protein
MLHIILSPSKTMDFTPYYFPNTTQADYYNNASEIISMLKILKFDQARKLLGTSEALTTSAMETYQIFQKKHTESNSKPAILAYSGDVYTGLDATNFKIEELNYSASCISILSGLYGIVRASDLIQPYRLDISAPIDTSYGKTLYSYWKDKVTDGLNHHTVQSGASHILNLASNEYGKAIDWKKIWLPRIDVSFLDEKNGIRKVISYNAKKARGIMASIIIKKQITKVDALKKLKVDGYTFDKKASSDKLYVYIK